VEAENRAGGAIGLGGRGAVGGHDALEGLAGGVGDHEPGRDPRRAERADHGAGRGADDEVGAAWVPVGLVGEGVQRTGEPGAPEHATGAEHEPDPHA
jgi:hypothetical protein